MVEIAVIADPSSGATFHVVEPGSPDDPFTKANAGQASAPQVVETSPAAQVPATQPVSEANPAPSTVPTEPAPAQPAVSTESAPATESTDDPGVSDALTSLQTFLQEEVTNATRKQQAGYDRTITGLKSDIEKRDEQHKQLRDELRNIQTNGLSDEQKKALESTWAQEDRGTELDAYATELDEMYRLLLVNAYNQAFSQFGITEDELGQCKSAEEMDVLCLEKKASFYEAKANGTAPATISTAAPAAAPKPAPASVTAATDLGGQAGIVTEERTFRTDTGADALLDNLRNIKPTTVRLAQR